MELNSYQRKAYNDLRSYLSCLNQSSDIFEAYRLHWINKDIKVGVGGVRPYKNNIVGVPHVCFKVPTGGGKTFLASASIKAIFEAMPLNKIHMVVWLVPSNAILEQTICNLENTNHPYRQRLDRDFGGRVMIYTKEQLLNGQNFSPDSVRNQLSVCVLSYDSFRSEKKEGRKVYNQNSQLAPFAKSYPTPETLIDGVDDTALIQVLNQLSPVIVVDESHNAKSDLSVEMLNNLNPSFVLDLTATPKENSNIISFVDARELKKENMVKLPVVVYNRNTTKDVIFDAIQLRASIEKQAIEAEQQGGSYIRPIVLFQAQPKGKDAETFEKIKQDLISIGISKEEIAIKTSDTNEIKGADLLSPDCKIRYIITVNALKEGWDCPFAYILATLANKTSSVDVEQIVGRVLRQPYAKKHSLPLLNNSYVLTCSNSFWDTLENIIKGLNRAGFDKKDMRVVDEQAEIQTTPQLPAEAPEQIELFTNDTLDVDFDELREMMNQSTQINEPSLLPSISDMIEQAQEQSSKYEEQVQQSENDGFMGGELADMMNKFSIQPEYVEQALALEIPQFYFETEADLFHEQGFALISKESFSEGFTLRDEDTKISFELSSGEVYSVDISTTGDAVPKYQRMSKNESEYIREHLAKLPEESKIRTCVGMICKELNKSDTLEAKDVQTYVERIIAGMNSDEIAALETAVPLYARKIKDKIAQLENAYREKNFNKKLDIGEVICRSGYKLSKVITPVNAFSSLEKSLYESEADANDFEKEVIAMVAGLENVKWWHRIIERKDFYINGFIHHYPDFMVMTSRGNLIIIECKGDFLANDDSKQKLRLGRTWADKAGVHFKYFMVFKQKDMKLDGAYTLDEFVDIMRRM
ncbi:MAG: DEAD/DEAH box helicase family protein [Anaerovoracaceae bacterium]